MKEEWKKVKLCEVCKSISDGDHLPPPKSDSGIPFVTIANIKGNRFDFSDTMFVPESYYEKLDSKRRAQTNDILYSVVGSFGIPVLQKNNSKFVFQRHIAILRPAPEKVNPQFLFYTMLSRDFYAKADALAVGAAQRTVSLTSLRNIEITLPPLPTQQKIASILSAYDDLIENNRKQIKLLEEAAQKLYKEWFIKLNFPGHENTKIVDGIPVGWKKVKLIDLVDVQYGYAFDGLLFNDKNEGTPIIRIRNIPDGTTNDSTTEKASEDYIVHNGDIVVGMDGEFHINTWNQGDAYLVQRSCSFRPHNELLKGYLFQAIYAPIKFFENTVVGATVAHLGKKHIDTIEVFDCPNNLYVPFNNFLKKRQTLLNQNNELRIARDKLLPKLMNGEIEV